MPHHSYRVTRQLPWMDGGRPGPNSTWIGGTAVVYEPGTTLVVDDREVAAVFQCLEATDDDGRAVLERAREALEAPAEMRMLTDFHPKDRAWLMRVTDEKLRQHGHIQDLVVRMLERREEPTLDDLAAAIQETPDAPIPKVLLDCVARVLRGQPRRPGPKEPKRTTRADLAIRAFYQYELEQARHAHEVDNRRSGAVADVAKRATAKAFGIGQRTVERVVALRLSPRKRPPV